jgi:hypothetical protein
LCGEDRDRETENLKVCRRTRDTRFIQVQVAKVASLSYGPPWAHYLCGYQNRLLGGPLGLLGLRYTAPEGVEDKDYTGVVLG